MGKALAAGALTGGSVEGVPSPKEMPLAARPLTQPHPSRLAVDHPDRAAILAAHAAALDAGLAGYLDPLSGLFVLTAAYLADRGTCCGRT